MFAQYDRSIIPTPSPDLDTVADKIADLVSQLTQCAASIQGLSNTDHRDEDPYKLGGEMKKIILAVQRAVPVCETALMNMRGALPQLEAIHSDVASHILSGTTRKSLHELKTAQSHAIVTSVPAQMPIMPMSAPTRIAQKYIEIVPGWGINAIPVDRRELVKTPGMIYYIAPTGLFAAIINGVIMFGNIGAIVRERMPKNVTECRHMPCTMTPCAYYHRGRDIRNYKESSLKYVMPANRDPDYPDICPLGSIDSLASDMEEMTSPNARLVMDLAFHWLLLSQIVAMWMRDSAKK